MGQQSPKNGTRDRMSLTSQRSLQWGPSDDTNAPGWLRSHPELRILWVGSRGETRKSRAGLSEEFNKLQLHNSSSNSAQRENPPGNGTSSKEPGDSHPSTIPRVQHHSSAFSCIKLSENSSTSQLKSLQLFGKTRRFSILKKKKSIFISSISNNSNIRQIFLICWRVYKQLGRIFQESHMAPFTCGGKNKGREKANL